MPEAWRRFVCVVCGYVYDEEHGDPEHGLAPGTRFEAIPDDWACPDCGVTKSDFVAMGAPTTAAGPRQVPAPIPVSVDTDAVVILGAGMAGWAVAERLRERDLKRRILLITRDDGDYYLKPELSNAFARKRGHEALVRTRGAEKARSLDVTLVPRARVLDVDTLRRRVITASGGIPYGQLVLATGALALPLPVPGGHLALPVNHLADHGALRQRLSDMPGKPVAVVGAGLVGCELANDLALSGHPVHLLEREERALARLLPEPLSDRLQAVLADRGVVFHGGCTVTRIESAGDQACTLHTQEGETLEVGLVIRALGIGPDTAMAERAGIRVARGIWVDDRLLTSAPGVYALGDGIEVDGQLHPYVRPLLEQSRVIAAQLCGEDARYHPARELVNVKTTSLPLLVAPPADEAGQWIVVVNDASDVELHCRRGAELTGFALGGRAVERGQFLAKRLAQPTQARESAA